MSRFYGILAIAGAVLPYGFFVGYMRAEGVAPGSFAAALYANGAAGGFTTDLLVSSLVFWCFLWQDHQRAGVSYPWLYVLVNLTIGLSCALPLYLFARTRREGAVATGAPASGGAGRDR